MTEDARAAGRRRPTLKDVARAAGVSQSTTSRALSGEGYVAAAVRERVRAAAEELDYVPHAMARSLRKQDSRTLGVLISDLRNTFYADLAAGIISGAREQGYTVMLIDDQGSVEAELEAARTFVATRVAGVVVTPLSAEVSNYLYGQRIAVVEADRRFGDPTVDSVTIDNAGVTRRLTDHLIGLGHRRLAMVIDETSWTSGRERHDGFVAALRDAGIETDPDLIVSAGWDAGSARDAAVDLLARRNRPTAVFAANNVLAEGVWRAVADLGLRIPDDISFISFDDAEWMSLVSPQITAVAQDSVALGAAAARRLLDRIGDLDADPVHEVLGARLLPRGSTGSPRRRDGE